jgi:hypothetical protein
MKLCVVALGLTMLSTTFVAAADTNSVFGISLGKTLTMSECKRGSYGYSPLVTKTCFQRLEGSKHLTGPFGDGFRAVNFPFEEKPELVSGIEYWVLVIDENVEGVSFNTEGVADGAEVLRSLKEKYGKPTYLTPKTVKNLTGGIFEAYDATWKLSDIEVELHSVRSSLDWGSVEILTKKGGLYIHKIRNDLKKPIPL